MHLRQFILLLVAAAPLRPVSAAPPIEFYAKHFVKDIATNTARGTGNAWVRMGNRTIWADVIEIDYNTNRAAANGNVHIQEKDMEAWARHAGYGLTSHDAVLDDATLVVNQTVMTGEVVRRLDPERYEIENGSYSNCNLDLTKSPEVGQCALDWRLTGRRFTIRVDGYAQVHDALMFAKSVPLFYSPYLIFPVKTQRQSGFLWPRLFYKANLGTAVTPPYFVDLGQWHDLTIVPDWFTQAGFHLGFEYRYIHSPATRGFANVYFIQRRFGPDPAAPNTGPGKRLGLFGEAAINAWNTVSLGGRTQSRQTVRLVSHRYYVFDYGFDFPEADMGYLRSQAAVTHPTDDWLFTARVQHHQPLVLSRDYGIDEGAVVELPTVQFAKTTTALWRRRLSWELDTKLSNFYRPSPFDRMPIGLRSVGLNVDPDPVFGGNDYLRTGRRVQVEPRLIVSAPMPPGFLLQPVLKAGTLLYHFDHPTSVFHHREYADVEVPFTLFLSRTFDTGLSGFEQVNHVIQPRLIYGASLYQGANPNHPFFYQDRAPTFIGPTASPLPTTLSAPRFDLTDRLVPYEFLRLELLNRFRRKSRDGISRFFRIDVSTQYNAKLSDTDAKLNKHWGPVEFLSEFSVGRVSAQFQANYPIQLRDRLGARLVSPVRETDFSGTFAYTYGPADYVQLGSVFRNRADTNLNIQTLTLRVAKSIPALFDVTADLEYSLLPGDQRGFRGYAVGINLHSRPRHCWELIFRTGRTSNRQPFAAIDFKLNFGSPSVWTPPI